MVKLKNRAATIEHHYSDIEIRYIDDEGNLYLIQDNDTIILKAEIVQVLIDTLKEVTQDAD